MGVVQSLGGGRIGRCWAGTEAFEGGISFTPPNRTSADRLLIAISQKKQPDELKSEALRLSFVECL
jgi:hypothetical protein